LPAPVEIEGLQRSERGHRSEAIDPHARAEIEGLQ